MAVTNTNDTNGWCVVLVQPSGHYGCKPRIMTVSSFDFDLKEPIVVVGIVGAKVFTQEHVANAVKMITQDTHPDKDVVLVWSSELADFEALLDNAFQSQITHIKEMIEERLQNGRA